jgi:microsomal dipeptidase-like Zn-dependent dipeptidase
MAAASNGGLQPVTTRRELEGVLAARAAGKGVIGGILATEGLHPIEGVVANLDTLFADGFRVFGATHFFDNEVGGSAHGISRGGLTPFGREVVRRASALGAILDLAHASPALFAEVLDLAAGPVLVSHVGVQATCPGPRNLSDDQLRAVAARGGIVGIGIWDGAICEVTPRSFARAVRHAIEVGGDEVGALGSEFDGATRTPIDAAGLDALTEAMLNEGLTADQVGRVLGGNALAFFRRHLPP